ncbi:MAG: twin-arginine translocation signal domain-containing protein, partial [Verrucomicrobiota bacterium]|nr:twin-arginine translocation signal domain-containing protein [Verrucomicrobiota bacterium]
MKIENPKECPVCPTTIDRRHFVKTAALGSAALAAAPLGKAAKKKKTNSETLVAQLFGSLNENQKKVVAFPFDHPLREKVDNNWNITKKSIGEIFTGEQQALVKEIFL